MKLAVCFTILFLITAPLFSIVIVNGRVVGSNDPETGLAGARVDLIGAVDYRIYSNDDGYFEFDSVMENQTYQVLVVASGYDAYMGQVIVGDEDIEMGDLVLIWIEPHPIHLVATESADQQTVTLTWTLGTGECVEYRYDDGMITGQLGYQSGGDDVRMGAAHYHDAQIDEITWYLTDTLGPHNAVDIYIYGLDETGRPDSGYELFCLTDVENTDNEWNTFTLPVPILAPHGFYIGLNYPEGFLALGTDDGYGEPYEYIDGTQWITTAASANDWHTPSELEYPYNFAIRANGLDFGEIEHRAGSTPPKGAMPDAPLYIDGYPETASLRTDRNMYLYFYRLLEGDEDNPETWTLLGEGDYEDSDTTFVDETWQDAEWGYHRWAIQYPAGEIAFSNTIPKIWTPHVEINVSTNSGDSPEGAYVVLENIDGNEDHVYEGYVPASGTLFLPAVWLGVYTLNVYLPRFDDYEQHNLIIDDMEIDEIDVVLTETLLPVTAANCYPEGTGFSLEWNPPSCVREYSQDFETDSWMSEWSFDGINESDDQPIPGHFTVNDYSSDNFEPFGDYHCGLWWSNDPQDEWLISPEFLCGGLSEVRWKSVVYRGSTYDDHYYLKISADGGETWDILWDASCLSGGWDYYEQLYSVDLQSYAGMRVKLAWHCLGGSEGYLWWVFFIDDIEIDMEVGILTLDDENFETRSNKGSKQPLSPPDRSMLGYRITYRDETIVELQEDTYYYHPNPLHGLIDYKIYAVYTTGEAEPYWLFWSFPTTDDTVPELSTALKCNSPNPFNPETRIDFSIASDSRVGIEVFNTKGQRVKTLTDTRYEKGEHHVLWRGDDDAGHSVSSGIYFYRMTVDGKSFGVKKMIMLK